MATNKSLALVRTSKALSCHLRHWLAGWTRTPAPQSVHREQLVQPGADGVGEGPATVCRAGMRGSGPWWGSGTHALQTPQALPGGPFLAPHCARLHPAAVALSPHMCLLSSRLSLAPTRAACPGVVCCPALLWATLGTQRPVVSG